MAKLYTKTGDSGRTGLFDGTRVGKDHPRVRAYGNVDELNALIGLCRSVDSDLSLDAELEQIQNDLFSLGAELATPRAATSGAPARVTEEQTTRLESWIDAASEATPPLGSFVLPAGTELACRMHHARTVCRRAERDAVSLSANEPIDPRVVVYLNRLSDLLFAWARLVNHRAGKTETIWRSPNTS